MRIVFQGSATGQQIGKAVAEIISNTLEKAEVKGQKYPIHNAVIEFNLNIQGQEKPMLLVDDEKGTMLTIHTGIEKGELTEYVEVDRSELIAKFDEMVANATGEETEKEEE
jgi:helix-turn-helix protein